MLVGHKTYQRQNLFLVFFVFSLILTVAMGRLGYLMIYRADYYGVMAKELHERERAIKAERGRSSTATEICWPVTSRSPPFQSFTARSRIRKRW